MQPSISLPVEVPRLSVSFTVSELDYPSPPVPTTDYIPVVGTMGNDDMMQTNSLATSPLPITKPKRPLSAYNLFFQFERRKIVANAPPDAPKIGFRDMARIISKRWRNVDADYKRELTVMANEENLRYGAAMRSYRQQLAEEAEHLQQQEEEASAGRQHVAAQAAAAGLDQEHRSLLLPMIIPTSDVTAPTNVLRDASIASLAEQLDDEMTGAIISIFS